LWVGGVAVWALGLWTVFANGKFKRKWLWVLLTFVSWPFDLPIGPEGMMSVRVPLGAIYVLLFALVGPRRRRAPAQHFLQDTEDGPR
jgi:hypothetical protein